MRDLRDEQARLEIGASRNLGKVDSKTLRPSDIRQAAYTETWQLRRIAT